MPRSSRGPAWRLALVYAAQLGWVGIYLPYWPLWLADRGMTPTQVGLLLAMTPWTRALANPAAGYWADRSGRADRLIRGLSVALIGGLTVFFVARGFVGLLLTMIGLGLVFAPIIPLTDGLTVSAEAQGRLRYGPVRLWGSVAFIVASWFGGELLESQGEPVILWALIGLAGAIAIASMLLPAGARPTRSPGGLDEPAASPWSRPFVSMLVVASLFNAGHAVLYAFGSQHWRAHGLDEGTVGLLWAEGVVAEIILFALAARLDRLITPRRLWLLAGLGGVIRWGVLATTVALPWLVLGQALHAFTFGAVHLGAMATIRSHVAPGARGRAATGYSAIATGLAMGVALPLAGVLYDRLTGDAYWVMAGLAGAGLLLTVGLRIDARDDRGPRQHRPLSSARQPTSKASSTDSVTGPHASSPHTAKST